jgi:hypothetical protein
VDVHRDQELDHILNYNQDRSGKTYFLDTSFRFYSGILILTFCLVAVSLIFIGFLILEINFIDFLEYGSGELSVSNLTYGIVFIIIAPIIFLAGYPMLIHLYKRLKE